MSAIEQLIKPKPNSPITNKAVYLKTKPSLCVGVVNTLSQFLFLKPRAFLQILLRLHGITIIIHFQCLITKNINSNILNQIKTIIILETIRNN